MHTWLAEQLDQMRTARGQKLNLLGPRGGAKSTIGTLAFVLRARSKAASHTSGSSPTPSTRRSPTWRTSRTSWSSNERLAEAYPAAVRSCATGSASVRFRSNRITLPNNATIEAFGTGQRIRGRRRRANRPTLIVCDDTRKRLAHRVRPAHANVRAPGSTACLLKAGTKRTNIINLATALHREAIAMQLHDHARLDLAAAFRPSNRGPTASTSGTSGKSIYTNLDNANRKADARAFYDANAAAMDAGADVLWPDEEDLYTLMCMRVEGGRTAFEREKQNVADQPRPVRMARGVLRPADLVRATGRATCSSACIALDPSKGADARRGDYSAFVLVASIARGVMHVEADLARRPTPQIVADGIELCRRFAAEHARHRSQPVPGAARRRLSPRRLPPRTCSALGIVPIENHAPTSSSASAGSGRCCPHGRLRFKSHSHGTRLLFDQLREFPLADHDDGPDALEMAIRLADSLAHRPRTSTTDLGIATTITV